MVVCFSHVDYFGLRINPVEEQYKHSRSFGQVKRVTTRLTNKYIQIDKTDLNKQSYKQTYTNFKSPLSLLLPQRQLQKAAAV